MVFAAEVQCARRLSDDGLNVYYLPGVLVKVIAILLLAFRRRRSSAL